jgi:Ser/Thr protein kinase RdoA (MazF antagonist)
MIPVPQPVLEALAPRYGTRADALVRFGGGGAENDGIVYAYPSGEGRLLLKVMAVSLAEERRAMLCLDERLMFAHYLGTNGARIAHPLPSPEGKLYETFDHGDHRWVAYGMEIAPGTVLRPDAWDPAFFRDWGRTIGLLHRLAREYPSWRAAVDPETGEEFLGWHEEWRFFHDWCRDEEVRAEWVALEERLEGLPVERETFGFTHNDPHLFNLLYDASRGGRPGGGVTLLDFDVANYRWFINDIAIACQTILFAQSGGMDRPVDRREKLLGFLDLFMEGYEGEHRLATEWLERLDLFIAYRRILMYIVMYDGIRRRPKYRATWREMILSQPEVAGRWPVG